MINANQTISLIKNKKIKTHFGDQYSVLITDTEHSNVYIYMDTNTVFIT